MMEDFVRFCDGDDDAAKRVIGAMREERPPPGALQRAIVTFGVSGAGLVTATSALGSAGSAPAVKGLVWLAIKWLSVGAALGVAAGTGATVPQPSLDDPKTAPPAATDVGRPATPVSTRGSEQRIEERAFEVDESKRAIRPRSPLPAASLRSEPSSPAATGERPSTARFDAPPVEDTLAREVELLDEVRRALKRKAPNDALFALERFTQTFPRGRLSAEAFVLRLDALVLGGRKAEARALGERYLASNPGSPHAVRIRKITGLEAP